MNIIFTLIIYGPPILLIIITAFKLRRMIRREQKFLLVALPLILAVLSAAYFGWGDAQKDPRYCPYPWGDVPIHHTMIPVYLMMSSVPALIAVCFLGNSKKQLPRQELSQLTKTTACTAKIKEL